MIRRTTLLIGVALLSLSVIGQERDYAVDLISKCNFKTEVHRNIRTGDNYLLTMQRILTPVVEPSNAKVPVLMLHGLFGSAEHFVLMNCQESLGYQLSNQGYDVWLGNVRSVSYSRHHVYLNPNSKEYWQITMDEYGMYDLPAMIDYILKTTNSTKLMYVGHSQGNLLYYVMCSNRPEYADKVSLFVNLSPIATLNHLPHPWLPTVCRHIKEVELVVNTFGLYEWTLGRDIVRKYYRILCGGLFTNICKFVIYLFSGMREYNLQTDDMMRLLTNAPEGIAAKQFIHGCQMYNREQFMKYDYGPQTNLRRYGSIEPPEYIYNRTKTPTAMYYAEFDWFLDAKEALRIASLVPNVVDLYLVPQKDFSHFDFIIGHNAVKLLYPRIINLMNSYRQRSISNLNVNTIPLI